MPGSKTSSSKNIPGRFTWAAKIINVQPGESVLEIGCGTGILAGLMAEQITEGKIVAIDQSAAMVKSAIKRNQLYLQGGKMKIECSSFPTDQFEHESFDKVVAFNVPFFRKNANAEIGTIKKLLAPKGSVFIFHQAPFEIDKTFAKPLESLLEKHGYTLRPTLLKKLEPSAVCTRAEKIEQLT